MNKVSLKAIIIPCNFFLKHEEVTDLRFALHSLLNFLPFSIIFRARLKSTVYQKKQIISYDKKSLLKWSACSQPSNLLLSLLFS